MADSRPADPKSDGEPKNGITSEDRDFISRKIRHFQNRIAIKLGSGRRQREAIVISMLRRHRSDTASYWLQIVMSLGIATLGLVLDSTAVVIGAMLISPLMEPIVGLGMGLAVGSPFLTLRSAVRVFNSIVGVILIAAFITMLLPFQEITSEIASRTSPTALDLGVATFCALAAAFTTVKQSSDTAAAAAGTAIGIALVPPLCVSGFGLGIWDFNVFGGALLLFLANLVAILLFSVLVFYLTGFNQVEVSHLESTEIESQGVIATIARRVRAAFGAKYGYMLRLAMPVALLASVYMPLIAALEKVAWEVEVRRDVGKLLKQITPSGAGFVRTQLTVGDGTVAVSMVMMGTPDQARNLKHRLETEIARVSGVVPKIEVLAVPDHDSLAAVAKAAIAPAAPTDVMHRPDLADAYQLVTDTLERSWPDEAGTMLRWDLEFDSEGRPEIRVIHTGGTVGPLGRRLLGEAIGGALAIPVSVIDTWIELGTWPAPADDIAPWLPRLLRSLATAGEYPRVHACVTMGPVEMVRVPVAPPPEPAPQTSTRRRKGDPAPEPVVPVEPVREPIPGARAALEVVAAAGGENVRSKAGTAWAVSLQLDPCPIPKTPAEIPPEPTEIPPAVDDVAGVGTAADPGDATAGASEPGSTAEPTP